MNDRYLQLSHKDFQEYVCNGAMEHDVEPSPPTTIAVTRQRGRVEKIAHDMVDHEDEALARSTGLRFRMPFLGIRGMNVRSRRDRCFLVGNQTVGASWWRWWVPCGTVPRTEHAEASVDVLIIAVAFPGHEHRYLGRHSEMSALGESDVTRADISVSMRKR